ncbi:plasmid stabilization system protein [Clostridia bacterium]|nr:plasmid stabilization system protein [Clostridia bacterium]
MKVRLSAKAEKDFLGLDKITQNRIKKSLKKLENEPPQGDIKPLKGRIGLRLRVGNFRILFLKQDDCFIVSDIEPRGQVYKGGR